MISPACFSSLGMLLRCRKDPVSSFNFQCLLAGSLVVISSIGCSTINQVSTQQGVERQRIHTLGSELVIGSGPINVPARSAAVRRSSQWASLIRPAQLQEVTPPNAESAAKQVSYDNPELPKSRVQLASAEVETRIEPGELTLKRVEEIATANNPAILQSAANLERARYICKQVGLKPNPTIGYFGEEIGNAGAAGLNGGFVSQTFVRGQKLTLNRQVLSHEVQSMIWQVETQRQRVLTDVRLAFVDSLAAQKRIQLAEDFRSIVEKGVSIAEEKLEAGIGTRPDVLQSEIQLNEIELTIERAKFDLAASLQELAALAGVSELDGEPVGQFENQSDIPTLESAYSEIVTNSPQIAAAQEQVERARANLRRQEVQPISNVTAQLGAGADDSTGDAFANIQLSLPVPVHNKNQGNICAAQNEVRAAVENVERLQASIRRDLAIAFRDLEKANTTVRQYQTIILPKAESTVELVETAYQSGESEFLRVLTARRAYFDSALELVTAQQNRAKARINIDGKLLSGGLSNMGNYQVDDDLRGQSLNGQ